MIPLTSSDDLSDLQHRILSTIARAESSLSSGDLARRLGVGRSTIKRHVEVLLGQNKIIRHGTGRGTRYTAQAPLNKLPQSGSSVAEKTPEYHSSSLPTAQSLHQYLNLPLSVRDISGYDRSFVDNYIPNETFLLPRTLALALMNEGKMVGQHPAGTYARKVLEQLLIDLSWSSSQLEGNRYSLLATEELFKSGAASIDQG